jgi:murein DD-endopeptidase MepM/ murein hydrolase activator NlpD
VIDEVAEEDAELPEGLQFVEVPRIARTPPRNTAELVGLLEPLTELGVPLQQVLVEGMGSFPVAGLAFYTDDWLNPRFDGYELPVRLHKGLDIFADFGTPVRAPVPGRITRFSTGGKGGIGVWMADEQGTSYYFAHLLARPDDLVVGQEVDVGEVIGFVGDSGNARGGAPHLHLEIHQGEAIPPKPWVDHWLDQAIEAAPAWVSVQRQRILEATERMDVGNGPAGLAGMETSMLLTLLDPVGGSVGMLPSLNISPRRTPGLSEALTEDLIRSRIKGGLLVPSSREIYLRH